MKARAWSLVGTVATGIVGLGARLPWQGLVALLGAGLLVLVGLCVFRMVLEHKKDVMHHEEVMAGLRRQSADAGEVMRAIKGLPERSGAETTGNGDPPARWWPPSLLGRDVQ